MPAGDFYWTEQDKLRTTSGGGIVTKKPTETKFVDYFPPEADKAIARLEAVVTRASNIIRAESRPFKEGDIQATKVLPDNSNLPNLNYDIFPEVDSNDLLINSMKLSTECTPESLIVNYQEFLELKDLVERQGKHILLLGNAILQLQGELLAELKKSKSLTNKVTKLEKSLSKEKTNLFKG